MSHPDLIRILLNDSRKLNSALASNCVLDWFGRTFVGRKKVIEFYRTIKAENSIDSLQSTEPFEEERSVQLLSRQHPPENAKGILEDTFESSFLDGEPSTPKGTNDGHKTPEQRLSPPRCPPAPCRIGLLPPTSSDDSDSFCGDLDSSSESGCSPLDSADKSTVTKSPKKKKLRRRNKLEEMCAEGLQPEDSTYSELSYLEGRGCVTLHRQACIEPEKRDCQMFVSYRIHKDDDALAQVALIVYKPFRKDVKTRRNLMTSFADKSKQPSASKSPALLKPTTPTPPTKTPDRLLKRKFRI